ncbi:phage integrase SAM-like domain-containing protein [Rufibacter quisquiliarum]|uniref:Integrase n=1 Tax=Rufibacter quisquiliarum TaxID=1549639 RepID=A0A839GS69_9BACT|nr:phage integrase SAM-like domain-containing protein [Rufibacter quisquiliarum]MBA9078345.1 integrase [Rufibacter quisquiliarum]
MEINFYPKTEKNKDGTIKVNAQGKVSLQMVIHHRGPAKLGIGLSIFPQYWDAAKQKVTKKHPGHEAVNDTIEQKRRIAEEIEQQIRTANGYATVEEIALEFAARTRPPKRERKKKEVAPVSVDMTMEAINLRWKKENSGFVSEHTLRKHNQVVASLEKFSPGITGPELDESFIKKYMKYLSGKGLAKGTIKKHAEFLKLAREAAGLGGKVKVLSVKVQHSIRPDLTMEELRAVITTPLDKLHLEIERDVFVFQMFVPLRESHFRKLKPHHLQYVTIQGQEEIPVIQTTQLKTETPVVIPLPPLALDIWNKYGGVLPFVSQQRRNAYIKKICLQAGLTRPIVQIKHKLKGFEEEVKPLWFLVSTYTTRHTAASLMLEVTGDESLSGWLLGHTNHGIAGVTGVYAKKKAAKVLPAILEAWKEILGDTQIPG